ncbi:hypothetical protein PFISCL1PPCAC_921, partial [Pristionchus fissidentatus]
RRCSAAVPDIHERTRLSSRTLPDSRAPQCIPRDRDWAARSRREGRCQTSPALCACTLRPR